MSEGSSPSERTQPDEEPYATIDLAIVVALLGGGPATDADQAGSAGPPAEKRSVEHLRRRR